MKKPSQFNPIRIIYNSDPTLIVDNHMSDVIYLLDIDYRDFNNLFEAIKFLADCTLPITNIEDIVPELKKLKDFKWVLPETHIKQKHTLIANIEELFVMKDSEWY